MTTCIRCSGIGSISGFQKSTNSTYVLQCSNCVGSGQTGIIKYAGIGSRETPGHICQEMSNIAMQLALRGFALRSGRGKRPLEPTPGTDSADLAFERGADIVAGRKVIRTATGGEAALMHASMFHPNWAACNEHARQLHARNSLIMLGDWLDDPVRFVICYTAGGAVKGGTGQALRIAAAMQIPVFNLAVTPVEHFWSWINGG